MTPFSSAELVVESEPLGPTRTEIEHLQLTEALDEPYSAELWLRVHDRNLDVLQLLGADLTVTLRRGEHERRICGFVRSVSEGAPSPEHVSARVELRPALWALSLRRNTRMFQGKSVPEIVETVLEEGLADYGREVQLDLAGTYPTREYCMQYQESDLAFVERLLSEEGLHYTFDHTGDVERVVIADSNEAFVFAPGSERLPFRTDTLELADGASIEWFARTHDHTTTSVVVRDFDWTAATPIVEGEERTEDRRGRDRERYEHGVGRGVGFTEYDPGSRRYGARDVERQKVIRLEAHCRDVREASGTSRGLGLSPGTRFELFNHPTVGFDGEYYVTRAEHVAGAATGEDRGYRVRFECRPLDVVHRPPYRRSKPTISSIQSAIVTGPSGEEIHTDEHGRVKVRFHWDRENPADETSSCWVRCQQAWAGPGWGFLWVPRIGMEVVVHFIEGDPDRPLITGCVYNGENRPPYALPDEKTKSTIKSNSSPGGGGFNELRFEDKAGAEEIFVHAQKDYNEVVLNDHTTTVHHDQKNEVDNDQTQAIGNNQTETVHGNQSMSVGGDRTVHVKGNFDETVDGTETRHTAGDVSEAFGANETRDVSGAVTEDIGGNEDRQVGGSHTENVGASHSLTIGAASDRSVGGSHTATVGADLTETAPAGYNITATAGFKVTVGGPTTFTTSAMSITAPGGVRWIDECDFWFGSSKLEFPAYSAANFNLKLEHGNVAYGLAGLMFEQAGVEVAAGGVKDVKAATRMKTDGGEAKAGALKKWIGALLLYG